jgi:hypothetical protein
MRTDFSTINKRYDKKSFYRSINIPIIKEKDTDILYISKLGDRLDNLSYKFYKDAQFWWIIALINNLGGRMGVPVGTQLRIPLTVGEVYAELNENN